MTRLRPTTLFFMAAITIASLPMASCQTTTAQQQEVGWSGLVNPNKARDLADAASTALKKSRSYIAGNIAPLSTTHERATKQSVKPDDPYLATCRVAKGTTSFADGWRDFDDTAFTIRKGEAKSVKLTPRVHKALLDTRHRPGRPNQSPRHHSKGKNAGFWVMRDEAAQSLIFCAETPESSSTNVDDCIKMIVLDDYLSAGIKRTLDIPGAVRGGMIACAYEPTFLAAALKD